MDDDPPVTRTNEDVVRHFHRLGAPEITSKVVLVMIGLRMYRREAGVWYLVENRPPEPRSYG